MSILEKRLNAFAEKATQERAAKVQISYNSLAILAQFKLEDESLCKAGLMSVLDAAEPSLKILDQFFKQSLT